MRITLVALILVLDIYFLRRLAGYFTQPHTNNRFVVRKESLIIEVGIWALRFLLFQYLLLFNLGSDWVRVISVIIFLSPHAALLVLKLSLNRSAYWRVNSLTLFFFSAILTLAMFRGEDSWDGSAYHLPIEFLAYKTGSLWGWQEYIYIQWQSSTIELSAAFYDTVFGSARIGIVINYILVFYVVSFMRNFLPRYWPLALVFLAGTPAFLQQLSTRYVDLGIACLGVISFLTMFHCLQFSTRSRLVYWLIPLFSMLYGSKVSALLIFGFQLFFLLALRLRNFDFKSIRLFLLITCFSFLIGNLPVGFRNWILFQNPFYPYKNFLFESGYFDYQTVSSGLSGFFSTQIGFPGTPTQLLFVHQYMYSPFKSILSLVFQVFSQSNFMKTPDFYRVFIYDNRLGGFGVWFPLLILFSIVLAKKDKRLLGIIPALLAFLMLPTSFHARYYLGVGLLILVFVLFLLEQIEFPKRLLLSLVIACLPFAAINSTALLLRNLNLPPLVQPIDRASANLAHRINPECRDSIHVGSGPWLTSALFGPNLCKIPVLSFPVGGSLLDASIGEPKLRNEDLETIATYFLENRDLLFICSRPSNSPDPCVDISKYLTGKLGVTMATQNISEAKGGPQISTLLPTGVPRK